MAGKQNQSIDSSYDVVVIGGGNGGLGAALKLASKGVRTLLLEQHNVPGGFATSFVRGRFEFEASLHELSSIGPADRKGGVRKFLEDESQCDIEWLPVPEAYRLILYGEGLDITLPFGIEAFKDTIAQRVPGSREAIDEYFDFCIDVSDALEMMNRINKPPEKLLRDFTDFMKSSDKPAREIAENAKKMSRFLKTVPCTVDEVTKRFNLPDEAVKILYPYWCYLGIPMSRLSFTIWAAMLIDYMKYGAYVPRMRAQELANAMEARIRELGGHVEYNTMVERIIVRNGKVTGVETAAGDTIKTKQVICNASPTVAFNEMVYPKNEVPKIAYKYSNARKHGGSGFVLYLGLNKSPEELGIKDYGFFISKTMNTDDIYGSMNRLSNPDMQATICLNNAVPDCSPPGTTIISFTTLFMMDTWKDVKPRDYFKLKNSIASDIIDVFESSTGTRIRPHIEEIEVATPATFSRYGNTYGGGIYGYELDPWDAPITRILNMKNEQYIDGLTFAGGYSFIGHGFSSSILSGRAAGQIALKNLGGK